MSHTLKSDDLEFIFFCSESHLSLANPNNDFGSLLNSCRKKESIPCIRFPRGNSLTHSVLVSPLFIPNLKPHYKSSVSHSPVGRVLWSIVWESEES